ncbi:hypothetical protein AURDEDRAFT_129184 [Auricularia subglabra TFB-10046 SS5]|uniref:Uncharacterized protein n=1 Tax=Auricularia subglabra (strain TFB-10046 / SS5) TaxID=717982 RepID=J0LI13_AURST|nr:hypothetical protein AURDEDRAFT_129184 [Auricularia subglabra TFB-10046 SS5]
MPTVDPLAVLAQAALQASAGPNNSAVPSRPMTRAAAAATTSSSTSSAPSAQKRKVADRDNGDGASASGDSDYEIIDSKGDDNDSQSYELVDAMSSPELVAAPVPVSRPTSSRPSSSRSASARNKQHKPPVAVGASARQQLPAIAPAHPPYPIYPPGIPYYGFPPGPYGPGPGPGLAPYPYPLPYPTAALPAVKAASTVKASKSKPGPPAALPLPASASLAERAGSAVRVVRRGPDVTDMVLARPSASVDATEAELSDEQPDREFEMRVTLHRHKVGGKSGKLSSVTSSEALELGGGGLGRVQFITKAFAVHHLATKYRALVDPHGGPPMKIWWKGSPGGKVDAETVMYDDKYNRLYIAWLKSGQPTINVSIDMSEMEPYKIPDADEPDVPSSSASKYDGSDGTVTSVMAKIEALHKCPHDSHTGPCVPDSEGKAICARLTMATTKVWAGRVIVGKANVHELPSDLYPKDSKPSRKGPVLPTPPPPPPPPPQNSISPDLLLAIALGRPLQPPAPAPLPDMRSSSPPPMPPPVDRDQLFQALTEFREHRKYSISVTDLMAAHLNFHDAGYTPDSFECVTLERIRELSGFDEGTAAALKSFCCKYANRLSEPQRKKQRHQ